MAQAALSPADCACSESWEQDRAWGLTQAMLPRSCEQSQPAHSLAALRDASPLGACEIQAISTSETPQPQLLCDFQDPHVACCPVSNPPAMSFAQGQEGTLASHSAHPGAPKFKLPPFLGLSFTGTAACKDKVLRLHPGSSLPAGLGLPRGSLCPHPSPADPAQHGDAPRNESMAAPMPFPAPHLHPISSARGQPCSAVGPRRLSKAASVPKIISKQIKQWAIRTRHRLAQAENATVARGIPFPQRLQRNNVPFGSGSFEKAGEQPPGHTGSPRSTQKLISDTSIAPTSQPQPDPHFTFSYLVGVSY